MGSIIFIFRQYDAVLFPHLSTQSTVEGFPPSAITRGVFHQRAHEVRIIMNSFTLKDSASLFFLPSPVYNILFAYGSENLKTLRWANRRWIFHSGPVALPAGQRIKAASCLGFALKHYNCYWLPRRFYSVEGENPWPYSFFFFYRCGYWSFAVAAGECVHLKGPLM